MASQRNRKPFSKAADTRGRKELSSASQGPSWALKETSTANDRRSFSTDLMIRSFLRLLVKKSKGRTYSGLANSVAQGQLKTVFLLCHLYGVWMVPLNATKRLPAFQASHADVTVFQGREEVISPCRHL